MAKRSQKQPVQERFAKELAFLKQQLELRVEPRRSMHALQEAISTKKTFQDPDRNQPLPQGIKKALLQHQKVLVSRARQPKSGNGAYTYQEPKIKSPDFIVRGDSARLLDMLLRGGLEVVRPQHGPYFQTSVLSVDPVNFINPVSEGATETQEGNYLYQLNYKSALSKVGSADLDGPNAQAWNRTCFGFVSVFALPSPGKQNTVNISSHLNASFLWLEALSFGQKAWGQVTANAQMDVLVASSAYRDGVYTFLQGESPRGNWNEGEIGVYNPIDIAQAMDLNVQLTITNPADTAYQVAVFELVEFIAERHYRVDRCDAVISGACNWDPLHVEIVTRL